MPRTIREWTNMLMTVVLAVATSLGTAYMALSYSAEAAQRHDRQIEDQAAHQTRHPGPDQADRVHREQGRSLVGATGREGMSLR